MLSLPRRPRVDRKNLGDSQRSNVVPHSSAAIFCFCSYRGSFPNPDHLAAQQFRSPSPLTSDLFVFFVYLLPLGLVGNSTYREHLPWVPGLGRQRGGFHGWRREAAKANDSLTG